MKRWFLSAYMAQIKFVEQGARPDHCQFGNFFDSWEEARERLIEREKAQITAANKEIARANKIIEKAKKMEKPAA